MADDTRGKLVTIWNSMWLRGALIASTLFLSLLQVYNLNLFRGSPDPEAFGTVSDWFTGIATIGTILVAVLALRSDRQTFLADQSRNQRLREEDLALEREKDLAMRRSKSQAVFAWYSPQIDAVTGRVVEWSLNIANRTGVPIFEWTVRSDADQILASSSTHGPLLPGALAFESLDASHLDDLSEASLPVIEFRGASTDELYVRKGASVRVGPE